MHPVVREEKLQQYESSVQQQVERLKELHMQKIEEFREKAVENRPMHARPSKELLNQREIEKHLAKQGQYQKAEKIKKVTDKVGKSAAWPCSSAAYMYSKWG